MANDVTRHPYGAGSHAPLGDVREMPACYPIKGNVDSMLYHRSDSQNYGATVAEVWFDSPSAAEVAGFVLAPGHSKDGEPAGYEPGGSGHPCSVAEVDVNRSAVVAVTTRIASSGMTTVDGVAGDSGTDGSTSGQNASTSDAAAAVSNGPVDIDADNDGVLQGMPRWPLWLLLGLLLLLLLIWLLNR
jgi:hypothetical protein